MAKIDVIAPKMGESIFEVTILNWLVKPGDKVEADQPIAEIATDKVDSEVPAPVDGVIGEILADKDQVVEVGKVIATILTENEASTVSPSPAVATPSSNGNGTSPAPKNTPMPVAASTVGSTAIKSENGRFYSPLVKNIAKEESIGQAELDAVPGTGMNGRVTKKDILGYVKQRTQPADVAVATMKPSTSPGVSMSGNTEIIEMDRMRKLIADHMVMSVQTSPHVTSFVEADVTNLFNWRSANKGTFQKKYGQKITFTPIIIEAVVRAIKDFPMINVSVDGKNIIVKKDINIGMAAALPSGNLIVPVIKNADMLSLAGLTTQVNDLATRARENKLKPDEIQGGTFTLTNVGTFGNVMGTPIINQPQVAILAAGAIRKKPAVVETEYGDLIAVRQMMFLSLSYDHRVVDGFLGGSFVRRVADYLESFDHNRPI